MDWNWSYRAFRLFDVDVRIHWSLFAYFFYYVLRGAQLGYSLTTLGLFVVVPIVLLFASVVAHEYGHVFAARYRRLSVGHMVLTPIGGMVMVAQGRTPSDEAFVAAAGPMVNLGLAIAASAVYFALGGAPALELYVPFLGGNTFLEMWREQRFAQLVLYDFINAQMALFLFNVVCVAYPMDGGRVLMAFFWKRRGFHNGLLLTCKIARVLAVGLGLVAVFTLQPMLAVIAFFVFFQAHTTMTRVHQMPDPGGYYGIRPPARNAPKKKKPNFVTAWLDERKEKKLRALLARAETKGIASLTAAERAWLKKARESRMN